MSRTVLLVAHIELEILNEENYKDFDETTKRNFLIQEMLNESVWPPAGIGCNVIKSTLETRE